MPIRARLALSIAIVVALTVIAFGALIDVLVERSTYTKLDESLSSRGREVATQLAGGPPAAGKTLPVDLAHSPDAYVEVVDGGGQPTYSSGVLNGAPPALPASVRAAAFSRGSALATITPVQNQPLRVYVQSVIGAQGAVYVVAGQPLNPVRSNLSGLVNFLFLVGVATMVGAFVVSWFMAASALRPLEMMARTVEEIGLTQDLSRRLAEPPARDEVGRLTGSFNGMLARLEQAVDAQRRFVADASHELRTPLTTIRSNAGLLLRHRRLAAADRLAAIQDIAGESERMTRLVDDLLALARADAGVPLDRRPVDLVALATEVVDRARRTHPDLWVDAISSGPVMVLGNPGALSQLVWILVENAEKHGAGAVRIGIEEAAPDTARLSVADRGLGIPAGDLERVFERFHQADSSRATGGAGLGLSVARHIAAAHGGTLKASNQPTGGALLTLEMASIVTSGAAVVLNSQT